MVGLKSLKSNCSIVYHRFRMFAEFMVEESATFKHPENQLHKIMNVSSFPPFHLFLNANLDFYLKVFIPNQFNQLIKILDKLVLYL